MKIELRTFLMPACIAGVTTAAIANILLASTAMHSLFAPAPLGHMKLDAFDEILLAKTILNWSVPFSLLCIAGCVFCAVRWKQMIATSSLSSLFLVSSLVPAAILWKLLIEMHGPDVNLWANCIWWHIGA